MKHAKSNRSNQTDDLLNIKLPPEYAKLKDTDFPATINGIKYKTKRELADRYNSDLKALAQLIYDMYQEKKTKGKN